MNDRVLIIDDDPSILAIYRDILSPKENKTASRLADFADMQEENSQYSSGFDITLAQQGVEGLERVWELQQKGLSFAAALIDIRMPPGMDGLETARRIRVVDDAIIIFIVSAYSDKNIDEIQQTLKHDVLYLRKPVSQEVIYQMVRDACLRWSNFQDTTDTLNELKLENRELKPDNRPKKPQGKTIFVDPATVPKQGENWSKLLHLLSE
ncbi:MAG: response regulator [Magnetococcales bacterium]|nr:response regulator [Magnetococcales bacterium]